MMGRTDMIWPGWRDCKNGLHERPDGVLTREKPPPWPTEARRIIVCGGRHYSDAEKVYHALCTLHRRKPITVLVHGNAPGADTLADQWARAYGVTREPHMAAWVYPPRHGDTAGPERNQRMIDSGAAGVVAFPGGAGTADLCRRAEAAGIKVWRPYG